MPFYLIHFIPPTKTDGKYQLYDEVYCERAKKTTELKAEFQKTLKTQNVKVRRLAGKG